MRVSEQLHDQAGRAGAEVAKVLHRITSLQGDAVDVSLQRLDDLRDAILREIVSAGGTRLVQLTRLRQAIERMTADYSQRFGQELTGAARESWDLGQDLVDAPLNALDIRVGSLDLPGSIFEAASDYSLVLTKGLSQDAERALLREVMLGATGVKSPTDVMAAIGESLDSPGVWKSLAARAEAITVTELGRIQSLASQGRVETAAAVVRGLKKQWVHGTVRPQSRENHYLEGPAGCNGQIRDVNVPYEIPAIGRVGAEAGMFPRDPQLSAANSVYCRCQSLPYRDDWAEDPDYVAQVAAAFPG
jgi:hypothetical protein